MKIQVFIDFQEKYKESIFFQWLKRENIEKLGMEKLFIIYKELLSGKFKLDLMNAVIDFSGFFKLEIGSWLSWTSHNWQKSDLSCFQSKKLFLCWFEKILINGCFYHSDSFKAH